MCRNVAYWAACGAGGFRVRAENVLETAQGMQRSDGQSPLVAYSYRRHSLPGGALPWPDWYGMGVELYCGKKNAGTHRQRWPPQGPGRRLQSYCDGMWPSGKTRGCAVQLHSATAPHRGALRWGVQLNLAASDARL